LKLQDLALTVHTLSGLNGLGSPFGFETKSPFTT